MSPLAPPSPIDEAKAPIIAFGKKNWDEVRASLAPGILSDEVPTNRKTEGIEQFLTLLKGWAGAFPDSKATFHRALAAGSTVVLEVTWHGTHNGPLQVPGGPIAATGKTVEVPACMIIEVEKGKAKSIRHFFDMATMLHQLGIARAA